MVAHTARHLTDAARLAAQLPDLLLRAEHLAHAMTQGQHARRRAGAGDDFWQYRPYASGDSVGRIDWRRSARADTLYVRERERQITQHLLVWADLSPSMDYASARHPAKADHALLLMLALASLALRGGDGVRLLSAQALARHPAQLPAFADACVAVTRQTSHPHLLDQADTTQPFVIASDFLGDDAGWDDIFRRLSSKPRRGILLHVLDPAEITLPFTGRVRVKGLEGEAALLVPNINSLRDAYQKRMRLHQDRLRGIARAAGWFYAPSVTDENPLPLLFNAKNYLSD